MNQLKVKLEKYGTATYTTDAPRGEIVDRNYTKLVQNINVICATYYAPKKITNKQLKNQQDFQQIRLTLIHQQYQNEIKNYFIIAYPKLADDLVSDKEKSELQNQDNYLLLHTFKSTN